MNSITQDMKYRQSLMKYAEKYGVSRASRKYNKARSYIYFWKVRWDGSVESLACEKMCIRDRGLGVVILEGGTLINGQHPGFAVAGFPALLDAFGVDMPFPVRHTASRLPAFFISVYHKAAGNAISHTQTAAGRVVGIQ